MRRMSWRAPPADSKFWNSHGGDEPLALLGANCSGERFLHSSADMSDANSIVVFNAGSSSLKAETYQVQPLRRLARAAVDGLGSSGARVRVGAESRAVEDASDHAAAAEHVMNALAVDPGAVLATGHRVVHGGAFSAPVEVTDAVLATLESLAPLAPLHNPAAVEVLNAVRRRFGATPAIAVFDTAFFANLPEHVQAYAIPEAWHRGGSVRRYGFHGIAHAGIYERYRQFARRSRSPERVVSLHLGHGCSAAAMLDGRPVDTSMGYTPLEGLIMGTRPGDLDAGIVLERLREGATVNEIDASLSRESGLLGLSGESADMRELLVLEARGAARAKLALNAFCHRVVKYVGAYAAALGGIDALLFGGGIGENAATIRERICAKLSWLGLELDVAANERCSGREGAIASSASRVEAYVIAVHEERTIARSVCEYFALEGAP